MATGSLQLSFQGYAFIIRGAVLSARSRGRYPIGSDVFLFHAFSKEIVLDRSFVSSPRYEPNTERGELSALLSFENLCIKAMNGRRSSTYSSFQYSVERCIKIVCKILLSIRTKHTDLSRIFTEIRNFQFLRPIRHRYTFHGGEREREKRSFLERRDQVATRELDGSIRSGGIENNSGKSILVRRVADRRENKFQDESRPPRTLRLNAIARFIFNLLAEESPSMQFKRSRRISFQTRNDDFLFAVKRTHSRTVL